MDNKLNPTYIPPLRLMPILPAVYGDELSYYETLAHLQSALNTNTEQLVNAFNTVYQMLIDGIGSGVAITYYEDNENIQFVVSSDIKPEEPIDNETLISAVAKNKADIAGLTSALSSESDTRSEADSDLSDRITAEANTRSSADTNLQNQINEAVPIVYTDETDDIEWGSENGGGSSECPSDVNERLNKLEEAVKDNEPTPIGDDTIRLSESGDK